MFSKGQPKAETKGVSLRTPGTGREACPLPGCPRLGVYSGPAVQCCSRKNNLPPALGLAGGAVCVLPSLSPGWVSGALAHSHADHVCHHRSLFLFLNLLVSVLSQCFG